MKAAASAASRGPAAPAARIAAAFSRAAAARRAAFIPYLTAGDPSIEDTVSFARVLDAAGADVLELGVPFSDPIADGPVIQRAASRALAAGATLERVFEAGQRIRTGTSLALVLFSYLNPLIRFGLPQAARAAAGAGFDGVLITDLPPEEAPGYRPVFRDEGLDTIFLVSPTSPPRRMAAAAKLSTGFLYVVTRSGITGARAGTPAGLPETVRRARRAAPGIPLAIGFGISTPEAAREAARLADGVVVGSALVRAAEEAAESGRDPAEALSRLASRLASACRLPRPGR